MDRILRQFGITHLPEEAHQRILHTLRTLQPVLGDTAVVVAPDGRILYSNDATAALLGFESSQQFATATPEEIFLCFDWLDPQGMLLSDPALPWVRMLQGDAAGRMVLGMRHRETRTELWHDVRWASVLDEQGVNQVTVITGQDITERRCAEETSRFLIEASAILSSSIDYPTTLDRVVRLGLPVVADCSAIYLPDSEGMLSLLAFAHADPEIERDGRELNIRYPSGCAGPAEVMRTGKSNLIADVPEELIRNQIIETRVTGVKEKARYVEKTLSEDGPLFFRLKFNDPHYPSQLLSVAFFARRYLIGFDLDHDPDYGPFREAFF